MAVEIEQTKTGKDVIEFLKDNEGKAYTKEELSEEVGQEVDVVSTQPPKIWSLELKKVSAVFYDGKRRYYAEYDEGKLLMLSVIVFSLLFLAIYGFSLLV